MNFAINIIDKVNYNSGTVTITGNSVGTVVESTKYGGFAKEEKKYSITGSVTSGVSTVIGRIKIEANSNSFFNKTPFLSFNNNIKLSKKNITSGIVKNANRNITTYNFDIIYSNTIDTYKSDNIVTYLNYKSILNSIVHYDSSSTTKYITRVDFGKRFLGGNGGTRKIKIHGDVGAVFEISIVEATEEKNAAGTILNITEQSILNSSLTNATRRDRDGKLVSVIQKTIDSTGVYSFNQAFPNNIVINGKLNGAMATDKVMDLDDARGVLVGDEIIMRKIDKNRNNSTIPRDTVTSESLATRVLTSRNLVAADDTLVQFARPKAYYIYIHKYGSTVLSGNLASIYNHPFGQDFGGQTYVYRLTQPLDPILSITTTSSSDYTINALAHSQAYTSYYRGKLFGTRNLLMGRDHKSGYDLTYVLDRTSGTHAIVGATAGEHYPRFDKFDANQSAWTNSASGSGGGYEVDIYAISTVLTSGNDIATITLRLLIDKWGTEDLNMVMDLTKFVKTA
tara:strand:+ start:7880 stop:9406 length:1527 start_codon:yes stop_codon:yes gene_type:complete